MYYILYSILYLFSLLPFPVIYLLSDGIAFLLFKVFKYRRDVVLNNLKIAFPEKTDAERIKIAARFYRNLTDTFLESAKLLSLSEKEIEKRVKLDETIPNALAEKGISIQFHTGHQFNWEYGNMIFSKKVTAPFIGIYMPITNKAVNKLFLKLRGRFKNVLVAVPEFNTVFRELSKSRYTLGLIADQNASPQKAHWLNFFGKPAPFVAGPDKGARKNGTAVIFLRSYKEPKRGFYRYHVDLITDNASNLSDGELTRMFRDYMEAAIREQPDNYLWSHKRWRRTYTAEYERRWVDTTPPPRT